MTKEIINRAIHILNNPYKCLGEGCLQCPLYKYKVYKGMNRNNIMCQSPYERKHYVQKLLNDYPELVMEEVL